MTGLLPDIAYHVRVRVLDDRFITPRSVVANFDTQPPDPSLVSISVGTVTTTSAEIRMAVDNPQSGTRMSLRYRETTQNAPWSATLTSGAGRPDWYLRFNFLSADTGYETELSIDPAFPAGETLSITFTSLLADPSLERLDVIDAFVTQTEAPVIVTIDDPSGTETVYLRRREFPSGSWSSPRMETTTTSTVDTSLSGLTAGVQ